MSTLPAIADAARDARYGLYGCAVRGDALGADAARWLSPAPHDWPAWTVHRTLATPQDRPEINTIDDDGARLRISNGGAITVRMAPREIVVALGADEPDAAVLHPALTPALVAIAHVQRRPAFHAGVVLLHGRAWGLVGHKGAGKSTLLAALAEAGHPVLSDDLLVLAADQALAGPRFIDLRQSAAERFPAAVPQGRLGLRQRFRLPIGPAPMQAPFGGWLIPDWGDELAATVVPPLRRIGVLGEMLSVRERPRDPGVLLELATYPMLQLTRPKAFDALDDSLTLVVKATARAT